MSSVAQGLNPEQLAAVEHAQGPLVIFAGAGSGKTRVITHRVAHLVDLRLIPPWRILAVTFTNKAARELRERLEKLVPGQSRALWVGTFHAVCARLLRAHAEQIGIRKDFVIYDDADQKAMLTRVLRGMDLDERAYPPKQIAFHINTAKQEGRAPDQIDARDPFMRTVREIYATYEERMAASSALDFGDLIYRLVSALRADPNLREAVRARFDHVLVDEFQDVNHVQFALVQILCERSRNLCVVGDDDQSIYRWRGADRRNILEFRQHFPDASVVKLEQNYRSTQRILRAANAVVARNLEREPKRLWTENEEGALVTAIACADDREEASTIVQAFRMLTDAGYARNDIALLYRKHAQSRVFEEQLRRVNMAYRVIGGLRFYDRAEVKDLLAYLRAIHNPADDVSLLRIINKPARGIGKTTIERLVESATRGGTSVHGALLQACDDSAQPGATRKKLQAFAQLLTEFQAAAVRGPSELSKRVLDETGYLDELRAEDSAEADSRIENILEVLASMEQYEAEASEPSLTEFLELVTLETDADRAVADDAITLMTVHAAKGLEFPVVFVAGLEEETFPHLGFGEEEDPEELEEERRLCYVAFTRARERLFVSHAHMRRVFNEVKVRRRSRFLDEVPRDEVHWVGTGRNAPRASTPAQASHHADERASGGRYVDRSEANDMIESGIQPGMRVRHTKFGVGEVTAVADGVPPRVTVAFADGPRSIISSFLTPA